MLDSFIAASHDINLLVEGRHHDPHSFLGLHQIVGSYTIRIWRPGASEIYLQVLGEIVQAQKIGDQGLFVYEISQPIERTDYQVYHMNGQLFCDPYVFLPQVGELDRFLFNQGCHYELFEILGAQIKQVEGVWGTGFSVWAPNAQGVSLIADFNHFHETAYPMRSLGISGVWELFVPGIKSGEKYKFAIRARGGYVHIKQDPMGFFSELRPSTASVVWNLSSANWQDEAWMAKRKERSLPRSMNIYEVHLGSWRNYGTDFPSYEQMAIDLAAYCKEMGFSHVELLPVMEHPLDESWGYQVTGFYAVTSRYGTPTEFQKFVDYMHREGIGVILDWVPAHFPMDSFSLARFDGTALYEHEDPRKGIHPHWQTAIFNYARKEVTNFLIASALFWLGKMHIDGLRVDAVASMLYLDYGRQPGEWIPNADGSNFNSEAIEFIKHLNSIVHQRFPDCLMIAEESSAYAGVTHINGLGFDLKWNMGWMNDTLRYFSRDPIYRRFHQNDLTFSLLYAFSERFMMVLSHDEVVHGKGSLLRKMPGPDWQKFANLRLLYSYMICHPGKKLLFMGGEFGQRNEWDANASLDWFLLSDPLHMGLLQCVRELNHLYHAYPAFWERDFDWHGYEWIDFSDSDRSVISYFRKADASQLLCVHNFTPELYSSYWIAAKNLIEVRELLNTDEERFGGSGKVNKNIVISEHGFTIENLSPLATLIFEVKYGS